jgi:hypothetical protein
MIFLGKTQLVILFGIQGKVFVNYLIYQTIIFKEGAFLPEKKHICRVDREKSLKIP